MKKWKWDSSKFPTAAAQQQAPVQLQGTAGKKFLLGFAAVKDSITA